LKESYDELIDNDPLSLSSSTAFFAIFSLIPIIILPLDLLGTIFSHEMLKEEVFNTLQKVFGEEPTNYLASILENIQSMQQGPLLTAAIILFLIFVATTLFHVVRRSFNKILQVKVKEEANIAFILRNRVLSLILILIGGILFLATFLFDILLNFGGDNISLISGISPTIVKILNLILSIGIFTIWLVIIYKYLPDIQMSWAPAWFGALVTAILFFIGQYLIGEIMTLRSLNTIYGASASLVLLLLFIFYSSFIFYYGFCMMKRFSEIQGYKLEPTQFSIHYEIQELD
jgi:membrane protein